jgi:hypothetical protein
MEIKTLLRRFSLSRLEITATPSTFIIRAVPDGMNPLVGPRRQAAMEAAAAAEPDGSISLAQARRITEESLSAPVATARGGSLEAALDALLNELKLANNHNR